MTKEELIELCKDEKNNDEVINFVKETLSGYYQKILKLTDNLPRHSEVFTSMLMVNGIADIDIICSVDICPPAYRNEHLKFIVKTRKHNSDITKTSEITVDQLFDSVYFHKCYKSVIKEFDRYCEKEIEKLRGFQETIESLENKRPLLVDFDKVENKIFDKRTKEEFVEICEKYITKEEGLSNLYDVAYWSSRCRSKLWEIDRDIDDSDLYRFGLFDIDLFGRAVGLDVIRDEKEEYIIRFWNCGEVIGHVGINDLYNPHYLSKVMKRLYGTSQL